MRVREQAGACCDDDEVRDFEYINMFSFGNQQGAEESVDWGVGVLGQRRRPHTPPTLCVNVPALQHFFFRFA